MAAVGGARGREAMNVRLVEETGGGLIVRTGESRGRMLTARELLQLAREELVELLAKRGNV